MAEQFWNLPVSEAPISFFRSTVRPWNLWEICSQTPHGYQSLQIAVCGFGLLQDLQTQPEMLRLEWRHSEASAGVRKALPVFMKTGSAFPTPLGAFLRLVEATLGLPRPQSLLVATRRYFWSACSEQWDLNLQWVKSTGSKSCIKRAHL